tara:strand:+ start:3625 stop:4017 length:393 start_codon:yes stop_codon:yes gene_type:complete
MLHIIINSDEMRKLTIYFGLLFFVTYNTYSQKKSNDSLIKIILDEQTIKSHINQQFKSDIIVSKSRSKNKFERIIINKVKKNNFLDQSVSLGLSSNNQNKKQNNLIVKTINAERKSKKTLTNISVKKAKN